MIVIFDLDGTLLNTIADLGEACNVALDACHLPTHRREEYPRLVGNGVRKLIERALPAEMRTTEMVEKVAAHFIPFYDTHNCVHTHPYAGIPELLTALKARGCRLAVASNKYQSATETIVQHFFPSVFDVVLGEREGVERKPSPRIVEDILDRCAERTKTANAERQTILYVGDSLVDRDTAKNAGVPFVACSWGFVPREQLVEAGVATIIDQPNELLEIQI